MIQQLPQDVTRDIMQMVERSLVLRNAGGEKVEGQYDGMIYVIPAGGETTIHDVYKYQKNQYGIDNKNVAKALANPASSIAQHLLVVGQFFDRGVFVKSGDKQIDAKAEQEAYDRYLHFRVARARAREADWNAKIKFHEEQELPLPVPSADLISELKFLAENKRRVSQQERKRFLCTINGWQEDTIEAMRQHVNGLYYDRLQQEGKEADDYIKDLDAPHPAQPKEEKPANEAKALIDKAKELNVNIKKELVVGMAVGDETAFAEVRKILADSEAA